MGSGLDQPHFVQREEDAAAAASTRGGSSMEPRQILKHPSFRKILPSVLISTDISRYIYIYILLLMQPLEATVEAVAGIGHYCLCR